MERKLAHIKSIRHSQCRVDRRCQQWRGLARGCLQHCRYVISSRKDVIWLCASRACIYDGPQFRCRLFGTLSLPLLSSCGVTKVAGHLFVDAFMRSADRTLKSRSSGVSGAGSTLSHPLQPRSPAAIRPSVAGAAIETMNENGSHLCSLQPPQKLCAAGVPLNNTSVTRQRVPQETAARTGLMLISVICHLFSYLVRFNSFDAA